MSRGSRRTPAQRARSRRIEQAFTNGGARFTLKNWEQYNTTPAPIFQTRREAEREATALRTMRAWVEVVEVEG